MHAQLPRLWCPRHHARTEAVPFARPASGFTRDFESLVAWLATRTDKRTITRMVRIDRRKVGRIVERVIVDELDRNRVDDLLRSASTRSVGPANAAT